MLESILQPFRELTWIQVFCNARIAGNEVTQLSRAESKDQNVSNIIVLTSLKTIVNLDGIVRLMTRSTPRGWKWRKVTHVLILSNAQTIEEITKLILTNVCSGDTDLTESSIKENIPRSMKTDPSQFVLRWMANANNDCEETQNSFVKHLQELLNHQYPPWDTKPIWYHINPRTSLVWNL